MDDCDIFYESFGSGPALVLLHGFPLDRTIWRPQAEELSKKYRVITPDLRGHGLSGAPEGVYSMDLYARDLNAVLDSIGVRAIILGGLSMGGYVAFAFYRLFKERVHGLILVDTKADADTPEARARREEQALSVLRNGSGEIAGQLIGRMFTEKTLRVNPVLAERVRRMMESTSPVGIAGALRGMAERPDSTPLLPSIKVPTLVIAGEEDPITPVSDAWRMVGMIPGSELAVVPGAAHLTSLEKPDEVSGAIRRFLEGIPKG